LEPFEDCFGYVAQRGAFRRYLLGLLSDRRRKSMSAMLARVSNPGTYQAFQHFIPHAPWSTERVWRRLRVVLPERTGVLILDGTSFPKQAPHSVGVARQYCGALGKVANCQVAVTAALWDGTRAWMVGAMLYLPAAWLTREARQRAQIPPGVRFHEKWRLALTLIRQVRASGFHAARTRRNAMGRLIPAGTGFEYYRHVRIPADEPPPPPSPEELELEREMEYFVEPEEAFTRDEIE
jgi:SRSO17 transposase